LHYYQHNIADYRKDTTHLTLLEHGCYHQLLDQYYLNEEPLPLDDNKLFRLLSARTQDEKNAIKSVLNDFFIKTEDGYVHRRCEAEIEQFHLKAEKASESAKRRWGNAKAMPTQCEGNTNHKPLTINQEPLTNIDILSDFEMFWKEYPRKEGKSVCKKIWNTTRPNIEVVLQALFWQKESKQWFEKGGQFIPMPATYLRQMRYMDEKPVSVTF